MKSAREEELEKDIETLNFIMARCTSDSAFRLYQQNLDGKIRELNRLRKEGATSIFKSS